MVEIYGAVQSGPEPFGYSEDCLSACYTDSTCILAYESFNGDCSLYSFPSSTVPLKVVKTPKEAGSWVAFKIDTSTCPVSHQDLDFTFTNSNGESFTWEKTSSTTWSLDGCKSGWTRFDRSDTLSVCIKGVNSLIGMSNDTSVGTCTSLGAVRIGVQTVAETQWMWGGTSMSSYWIAGIRWCADLYDHCNTFYFQDGLTTGNDAIAEGNFRFDYWDGPTSLFCLTILYQEGYTETLKDVNCEGFQGASGYRRFERSDGSVVCMKFVNGTGISKYSLSEKCYFDELPYKAFIASVHSVEESVWMQEEAGKYSTSNAEPMNYWTSGVRDGTCESTDSFDKKKNQFKWGDNITTGITALTEANTNLRCKSGGVPMNCLVVMSQGPTSPQTLGDFDCDTTASIGGGFCYYDLWREV
ncbi:unnamed protein product [Caenorhabditis brenneri]